MTMSTFRKATVAMFACAFGAILLDATPAHAAIGTPHCGGDVCGFVEEIDVENGTMQIRTYSTAEFVGHFELQTPEHTTFNSTPNKTWGVGEDYPFDVPFAEGSYCVTAWKLLSAPDNYEKNGYVCWDVTT